MAGHSKWANIQHRKGKQDKLRAKLFSKLSKEITVAAKMGDPDPEKNPRLRLAVKEARASSMPKDVIDRAIKKSQGGDAENYDEIRYEGYGPGGVAVIVEALTDNRNRAASDIRSFFTKSGGNLGETGSVSFMFDRTGIIEYDRSVASDDAVLDAGIEAGADDVISGEGGHEIYASTESYRDGAKAQVAAAEQSQHRPAVGGVRQVDGARQGRRHQPRRGGSRRSHGASVKPPASTRRRSGSRQRWGLPQETGQTAWR